MRLCLRWTDAGGPRRIEVDRRLVLGSSESVDVRLEDGSVSRLHAELEPTPYGVVVRDLASKNGTFVDRVMVGSAQLAPGHVLFLTNTGALVVVRRTAAAFQEEKRYDISETETWTTPVFVGGAMLVRDAANLIRLEQR